MAAASSTAAAAAAVGGAGPAPSAVPAAAAAAAAAATTSAPADLYPDVVMPYEAPRVSWEGLRLAPCFYDWREVYPFLAPLAARRADILAELTAATKWFDWPETSLYSPEAGHSWKVFPFLHTFPAWDATKSVWVEPSVEACPRTAALLRKVPGIRTALFSRMGPTTRLATHAGWADLANYVLRIHLPLYVPDEEERHCGLVVEEQVQYHRAGEFIVFDDSKSHSAFNNHPTKSRFVLIFDILRPEALPIGRATGATTSELLKFIDYFK